LNELSVGSSPSQVDQTLNSFSPFFSSDGQNWDIFPRSLSSSDHFSTFSTRRSNPLNGRTDGNPEYFKILFDPFRSIRSSPGYVFKEWKERKISLLDPEISKLFGIIKFRVNVPGSRSENRRLYKSA
jgi:hypothetical protein